MTDILAQTLHQYKADDDHATGRRLYRQGYADSRCANAAQVQGWYAACAEDRAGRAAYLAAMLQADRAGERVDWDGVAAVVYNAYGDRVVGC